MGLVDANSLLARIRNLRLETSFLINIQISKIASSNIKINVHSTPPYDTSYVTKRMHHSPTCSISSFIIRKISLDYVYSVSNIDLNDFQIHDESENEIGEITKTWKGCCKETFTDADNFRVICNKLWLRI